MLFVPHRRDYIRTTTSNDNTAFSIIDKYTQLRGVYFGLHQNKPMAEEAAQQCKR